MRNRFPILLIMLLTSASIHAQSPVDSLRKLLARHIQEDTARVDILNNLSYELRRTKPAITDSLLKITIPLSEKLDYKKGLGYALAIHLGRLYAQLKYTSADSLFPISKQLLDTVKDFKSESYLFRTMGSMKMDEGDYSTSLDYYLKALKMAQDAGDVKGAISIESSIGYLYNILQEFEKAIPYQTDALKHADSIGYKVGVSGAYNAIGKTYKTQGNYPASLDAYTKGLHVDEELKDTGSIAVSHGNIGDVYERMGNYPEAFKNIQVFIDYYKNSPKTEDRISWGEWVLAKAYTHSGDPAKGLEHAKYSYQQAMKVGWKLYLREITYLIAESAAKLHQWDTAYKYEVLTSNYKDSLLGQETARKTAMLQANLELDKKQNQIALLTKDQQLRIEENRREKVFLFSLLAGVISLIVFAVILFRNNRHKQKANVLLQKQKAEIDSKASNVELLGEIGRKITSSLSVETIISTVYDNVNALMDASVFGIGIYNDDTKSLDFPATYENGHALPAYSNAIGDENRFAVLCYNRSEDYIIGDLQKEYKDYMQHIPQAASGNLPASLIYLPLKAKDTVRGVITVQSFKQHAYSEYQLYMLRNIGIYTAIALENAESYKKLNLTIDSLKKTQTQLIQAEKMASLGELTAGIAHEIQNPLNFVNNFSEVNKELLGELKDEIGKGNYEEVKNLSNSIIENEEKIIFHGKRADGIVKSMLQHSRAGTGKKELVDINSLADEYLRLSYHGLRAKDKSFNAKFETEFDLSAGQVNIVPQDLGRVILNLLNNAFYAVNEKKRQSQDNYEPIVHISTKRVNGNLEIKVRDNGNGLPSVVKEKIFQPFFTTKPAGQGTGLGLSLAYDIVTKGHGGELKAESEENEGAAFTIILPY